MALTKVTGGVVSPSADYSINNVTGVAATFTGNVSIGGTLTYQDVSNIDAVGIITAQKGIQITGDGLNVTSGIATFAGAIDANSTLNVSGTAEFGGDPARQSKPRLRTSKLLRLLPLLHRKGYSHHLTLYRPMPED